MPRPATLVLGWTLALVPAACATPHGVERRGDGTLRTECPGVALAACLQRFGEVDQECRRSGYDIVYGTERRVQTGNSLYPSEEVRSEAVVRCRYAVPLMGPDPNVPYPPPDAAAAAPGPGPAIPSTNATSSPGCIPGASLACATTTGCAGAQLCAADGASLGPCECAPATNATPDMNVAPAPSAGPPP